MSGQRPGIALVGLMALGLAACAKSASLDLGAFERRASDGTLALYWSCKPEGRDLLLIDGAVDNPYQPLPIRDVEVSAFGVNAQGQEVSRATGPAADYQIPPMVPSPFRIELRLTGGERQIDLRYQYRGAGGGGRSMDARPAVVSNMIRDACSRVRG